MEKVAIIGTGIAGMGAAHFLQHEYDITLFEKNTYVGGHTNTVTVDEDGVKVPIDTGFMVYNHVTYPNLIRLFAELNVPTKKTSMSFSVNHVPSGLEFSGSGLNELFAQRRNIFNPRYIRMLLQINRFNEECGEVLTDPQFAEMTLGDYVKLKGFGEDFLYKYIVPMSSAVWSTPIDRMLQFPAFSLVRFFTNHGFLGLKTQHQWYTIQNGSQSYRERLIEPFRHKIHVKTPVVRVERNGMNATVILAGGERIEFDKVIVASHADEALSLLASPTEQEHALLSQFTYQENIAVLHTDERMMPRTKLAWSSWNYRIDEGKNGLSPSTVYWMNSLQHVSKKRNYFVNINGEEFIDPQKVLKRIVYTHPVYTVAAQQAQSGLPELNRTGPVYFCGSYFKYGFHEDAFTSGLELSRVLSKQKIWS